MTVGAFEMSGFEYKSSRRARRGNKARERAGLATLDANTTHKGRHETNKPARTASAASKVSTPSVARSRRSTSTKRIHRLLPPIDSGSTHIAAGFEPQTDRTSAKSKRKSTGNQEEEDQESRPKRAKYAESDLHTNTQLAKENARLITEMKVLKREAKALRHRLKVNENTAEGAVAARMRAHAEKTDKTETRLKLRIASLEDEKVQIQDKVSASEQAIANLRQRITVLEAEAEVLEAEKEKLHETATDLYFTCESVLEDFRARSVTTPANDTV